MTQLRQFTAMLQSCGHKFTQCPLEDMVFHLIEGGRPVRYTTNVQTVIVQGCFYEELYAYFNEQGELLEMQSHVVNDEPVTAGLRALLKRQ